MVLLFLWLGLLPPIGDRWIATRKLFAIIFAVNLLYRFWIHTETPSTPMGIARIVPDTPSHHRVRLPERNPISRDKRNCAGIFIRLGLLVFGSFEKRKPLGFDSRKFVHSTQTHTR